MQLCVMDELKWRLGSSSVSHSRFLPFATTSMSQDCDNDCGISAEVKVLKESEEEGEMDELGSFQREEYFIKHEVNNEEHTQGKRSPSEDKDNRKNTKMTVYEKQWYTRLEELRTYHEEHGTFAVNRKDNPALSKWASNQKTLYLFPKEDLSGRFLTKKREEALKSLGAISFWKEMAEAGGKFGQNWKRRVSELREFFKDRGHFNVPKCESRLFHWLSNVRKYYFRWKQKKATYLTEDRVADLATVGILNYWERAFAEKASDAVWFKKFDAMRNFVEEHGHFKVASMKKELGMWSYHQFYQYEAYKNEKKHTLTPRRLEALNEIGITKHWDEIIAYKFNQELREKAERSLLSSCG